MLDLYTASVLGQLTAKQTPLEWEPPFSGRFATGLGRVLTLVRRKGRQALSRLSKHVEPAKRNTTTPLPPAHSRG